MIANRDRNGFQWRLIPLKHGLGQGHAPIHQVLHRGYSDLLAEAFAENRAGQPRLLGEFLHRPGVSNVIMKSSQGAGEKRISQPHEEARLSDDVHAFLNSSARSGSRYRTPSA